MGLGVVDLGGDAGEDCRGFVFLAGAAERDVEPVGAVDEGVVGFGEVAGVGEVGGGFGELALEVVGEAEVIVGVEHLGVGGDGGFEVFLGGGELTQAELAMAALEQEVGVVRVFGEGFGVGFDGFLVLAAAGFGLGEGEVLGGGGERGVGGGDGVVVGLGVELLAEEGGGLESALGLGVEGEGGCSGEGGGGENAACVHGAPGGGYSVRDAGASLCLRCG